MRKVFKNLSIDGWSVVIALTLVAAVRFVPYLKVVW